MVGCLEEGYQFITNTSRGLKAKVHEQDLRWVFTFYVILIGQ